VKQQTKYNKIACENQLDWRNYSDDRS